jgi:hypothetical protein
MANISTFQFGKDTSAMDVAKTFAREVRGKTGTQKVSSLHFQSPAF